MHYNNMTIQINWKFYHKKKKKKKKKKNENVSYKNSDIFPISAQNIDCGYSLEPRRGGSNEYPQSMFPSKNKEKKCKPL